MNHVTEGTKEEAERRERERERERETEREGKIPEFHDSKETKYQFEGTKEDF